jgi:hypothetical protein
MLSPSSPWIKISDLAGALAVQIRLRPPGKSLQRFMNMLARCRSSLSLPLRDYLGSVLPGLADFPSNRVAELTPNALDARG